jgi:Tfp pilus assembly protein FimT
MRQLLGQPSLLGPVNGMRRSSRGLTLIELGLALAVVGVLLTLAIPSFRDFILVQRLKGVQAELVTDLAFARSEAASRGQAVTFRLSEVSAAAPLSCYIIFTDTAAVPSTACDCQRPEGARCTGTTATEIRTVGVAQSSGVRLSIPRFFQRQVAFDPANGSILLAPSNTLRGDAYAVLASIDDARSLRTDVSRAGRASACVPAGSTIGGPPC